MSTTHYFIWTNKIKSKIIDVRLVCTSICGNIIDKDCKDNYEMYDIIQSTQEDWDNIAKAYKYNKPIDESAKESIEKKRN